MDTHKNPEFCFLGKYCNSGLMSPSESLEPEVTLSQADNAQHDADLPPCSRFQGCSISVHITAQDQYALSDSLIFILLSLY